MGYSKVTPSFDTSDSDVAWLENSTDKAEDRSQFHKQILSFQEDMVSFKLQEQRNSSGTHSAYGLIDLPAKLCGSLAFRHNQNGIPNLGL